MDLDYFSKYFMKDEILNKNKFFNELIIFYLIYCHINQKPISYDVINQFIQESLKETFDLLHNDPVNKELLMNILDNIWNCNEFIITNLDDYIEKETITYDLKKMFKTLKKKSNNFSENKLKLASIKQYHTFNLKEDIDIIIKDFKKLLSFSNFYLKHSKCVEAKKEFYKSYKNYKKDFDIVNIKHFFYYSMTFKETFKLILECYESEKDLINFFMFFPQAEKNINIIIKILTNKFSIINIKLNLFSFFLLEIYTICKILDIDIEKVKKKFEIKIEDIISDKFDDTYNKLFLKYIFKSEETDNISYIYSLFNKDIRDINELLKLLILKTIVKYFRNITDIKKFIDDVENIREIDEFDNDNSNCLTNIKNALFIIYNKIINNNDDLALLYKGFLYLLMLYLLFINDIGIIKTNHNIKQLTDTDLYILSIEKKFDYKFKMNDFDVIKIFKVFFNISNIFKLVITKSEYSDIINYKKNTITEEEDFQTELDKQYNKDVIEIFQLYIKDDRDFYLKNNVREIKDIKNFLKLIKKYLPNMYKKILEYSIEISIFDTDVVETDNIPRSPSTSIVFSPNKTSPELPQKPQSLFTKIMRRKTRRIVPLQPPIQSRIV